jgi:hypothetical protein
MNVLAFSGGSQFFCRADKEIPSDLAEPSRKAVS